MLIKLFMWISNKAVILCSIVLLSLFVSESEAQDILPYLMSPTDTSLWVTWKTDSGCESGIFYGEDIANLDLITTGECRVFSDQVYDSNYYYHSVHLDSLEPDRFYYYRAVTGSLQSAIHRFRTQPGKGTGTGVYRVLVFGDHQVRDERYSRLLEAAEEKVFEKYGGTVEEHVNLILNNGDQVDQGTLEQYEYVHFRPSALLAGNVPFMTTVGNHETYGTPGISLYYDHFFYDNLGYKGISSPGGEDYYSYQQKNIVFIHLSSEHPTDEQVDWVRRIVDSVRIDNAVDWLVSIVHRPIQAEQFVGDISVYTRDRIIPILAETEKAALLISGHHHLYARGQLRDHPMYHIISGGGSWDQYWGQSTEKDFDDVQKTIDYWTYQIITFDGNTDEMVVESYAIGSPKLGFTLDNMMVDSFYRKFPATPPSPPSIKTIPEDSILLPYTWVSTPYDTDAQEPVNSVQFQISADPFFQEMVIDLIRDYENLYGTTGSPDYLPVDIHDTVDIFQFNLRKNSLPDGSYYIRVRHRDRNITWSEWSAAVPFKIRGSTGGFTEISASKKIFRPGENISVRYQYGPGNLKDWIGIYRTGEIPGTIPSADWEYVNGSTGDVTLNVSLQGKYFIAFFENDGYSELTERIEVYVVDEPVLTNGKTGYEEKEEILIRYSNAPALENDWIGIYRLGDIPGMVGSSLWKYISGSEGEVRFSEGLEEGYYFAGYFLDNIYLEAGTRTVFPVGSELAVLASDKYSYSENEPIRITYSNAPGLANDWIGIFRQNASPGAAPLVTRQFTDENSAGEMIFDLFLDSGGYYAALFISDSNHRISNKAGFVVEEATGDAGHVRTDFLFSLFPSPTSGQLHMLASQLPEEIHSIKMVTMTGSTIFEHILPAPASEFSLSIDLSGQEPGTYLVCLNSSENVIAREMVLVN